MGKGNEKEEYADWSEEERTVHRLRDGLREVVAEGSFGGGFAGTIQAFVKNDFVEEYRKALDAVFGEGSCHVLKVRKYGGMKVIA